jgi:hypothetical protein
VIAECGKNESDKNERDLEAGRRALTCGRLTCSRSGAADGADVSIMACDFSVATYTVSLTTAGGEVTSFLVVKLHTRAPAVALMA